MFSMVGAILSPCMSNSDISLAKAILDVGRGCADRYSLLV